MIRLPDTPELRSVAQRIVWFRPPEDALQHPYELLSYAFQHGTPEDMALLLAILGNGGLIDALEHAHPGIISPRSWAYWTLKAGCYGKPLPRRKLPE